MERRQVACIRCDALDDVLCAGDVKGVRLAMAEALASVVDCEAVTVCEIDPGATHFVAITHTPESFEGVSPAMSRELVLTHPLYRRALRCGDPRPARLSDEPDATAFQTSDLYRSVHGAARATYEIAVLLPTSARLITCVLISRRSYDFEDTELDALEAIRIPLGRIYRQSVVNDLLLRRVEQTPTPLTAVRAADRLHGVEAFATSVLKRWVSTQMSHAGAQRVDGPV